MKKIKSFGFWTALAGALTILVEALGKCFGFTVEEGIVNEIVMAVAGVLVVLGVVCMPGKENQTGDKDDTQTQEGEKQKEENENQKEE